MMEASDEPQKEDDLPAKGRFDQGLDQFLAEIELAQYASALASGKDTDVVVAHRR